MPAQDQRSAQETKSDDVSGIFIKEPCAVKSILNKELCDVTSIFIKEPCDVTGICIKEVCDVTGIFFRLSRCDIILLNKGSS